MSSLLNIVHILQPGWATARPTVIEFMERIRAVQHRKENWETLSSRLRRLKTVLHEHQRAKYAKDDRHRVYVGVADCAFMPEVRAIIEDKSKDVTKESVKTKLAEILPDAVTKWIEKRRRDHTALLLEQAANPDAVKAAPEPLNLAIAVFNCKGCSLYRSDAGYRWPHILEHSCFRHTMQNINNVEDDDYTRCVSACVGRVVSDMRYKGIKNVMLHKANACTRDIIKMCGQDPDTVTYDEMEQCGVRLRCRFCTTLAEQQVFDWKAAVSPLCCMKVI